MHSRLNPVLLLHLAARFLCAFLLSVLLAGCDDRSEPVPPVQVDGGGLPETTAMDTNEQDRHGLSVTEAVVRQPAPRQAMVAAFVTFRNDSDQAYTLSRVSSPRAGSVAVHRTTHDNGMMSMRPVEQLVVPPLSEVAFKPGDYHLMLSDVEGSVGPDDVIPLRFHFDEGVVLEIEAEVRPVN